MPMHLLLSDIVEITGGKLIAGDPSRPVGSFSTDTRTLQPGDFYLGLKGPNFDGSKFAGEAFRKGALGVMVQRRPPRLRIPSGKCLLRVDDVETAMGEVASLWRRKLNPLVLAVMGSSGKTTTKEMIAHIASQQCQLVATKRNFNNTIGVPLTLFDLDETTELLVVEIGMNTHGELRRLAQITDPDFLVVTNIGRSHIGMFGSQEQLIRAKAEVFEMIRPECALVINDDCSLTPAFMDYAMHQHPVIRFGTEKKLDVCASDICANPSGGYDFDLFINEETKERVSLPIYGRYNVHNALASIAAMLVLDMDFSRIDQWFLDFKPASMRSETLEQNGVRIISDCYNANPDSVIQSLSSLYDTPREGRTYIVLGDMLELGSLSRVLHEEVGAVFKNMEVNLLVTYGDLAGFIGEEAARWGQDTFHAETHEEIAMLLFERLKPGDTVLIKGSRLMELERVTERLIERLKSGVLVNQE